MRSDATTVEDYLADLPPERHELVATVRDAVREHLPAGYEETMAYGMISWQVPRERYPTTYNGQPLGYVALASQKQYCALYLLGVHGEDESGFRSQWSAPSGKALDMGKSCVRFRRLEDLDLDLVGRTVAATSVEEFIERYEASRAG